MTESKTPSRVVVVNETETIDLSAELKNMKQSDQLYIKRMEAFNKDRVRRLNFLRRRNFLIGVGVAAGVIGIYSYTMGAVKQEGGQGLTPRNLERLLLTAEIHARLSFYLIHSSVQFAGVLNDFSLSYSLVIEMMAMYESLHSLSK